MLDVKPKRSLIERARYAGNCDLYGRRNGLGTEKWRGKEQEYSGSFFRDAYHGDGVYKWDDQTVYEGQFYSNHKDGYGVVSLSNGSTFEGLFSDDRAFGPGVYTYVNGRQDVGFWCGDKIVRLSRPVDYIIPRLASTPAGKLKLLQFQTLLPYSEVTHNALDPFPALPPRSLYVLVHPQFNVVELTPSNADENVKQHRKNSISLRSTLSRLSDQIGNLLSFVDKTPYLKLKESLDVGSAVMHKYGFDESMAQHLYSNFIHDPRSLFFNQIACDERFFNANDENTTVDDNRVTCKRAQHERFACPCFHGEDGGEVEDDTQMGLLRYLWTNKTLDGFFDGTRKDDAQGGSEEMAGEDVAYLISWNRSDLCMEMLKKIFKFRFFEDRLTFQISDLMAGQRTKFRKTGELEGFCIHFLKMCSIGPPHIIKEFLCSKLVSESLMDSRGNNSIMFAAAGDQCEIIDILLDYGADVNSFNDENLTPLNLCLLRRLALAESIGNWEVSFLPAEADISSVIDVNNWKVNESIESLDRVFGDGGSDAEDRAIPKPNADNRDSAFFFDEDSDAMGSDITLLKFVTDPVQSVKSKTKSFSAAAPTNSVNKFFVPVSYKREEYAVSVAPPKNTDAYFFDLSPQIIRDEEGRNSKGNAVQDRVGLFEEGVRESEEMISKMERVDRTIALLLKRGADPNLGDAPKPSLHLAVHSRNLALVKLLLSYGAAPDSHSLPQEGLLTPLHVLVLMKPSKTVVEISRLILNYGASPEEETSPSFNPGAPDDTFVDPSHGRTPLQLLCTRPDAEYVDPHGFLSELATLLLEVSKRRRFFKGHSYLSLAMMCGNVSIMRAILKNKSTRPNEVLGNHLGTALHVLVSTNLQKRIGYETSLKMCDLLLDHGANPKLSIKNPASISGTCVDYGYREIMTERTKRMNGSAEWNYNITGDYLENHVRIVDYLARKSGWVRKSEVTEDKKRKAVVVKKAKPVAESSTVVDKRCEVMKICTRTDAAPRVVACETKKIIEIKKHVKRKRKKKRLKEVEAKKMPDAAERKRNTSARRFYASERLPERFRQSLLHMFQIYGSFDLNDLMLPYVVLRNGDLYYRFKGRKPSGTEQYSLI